MTLMQAAVAHASRHTKLKAPDCCFQTVFGGEGGYGNEQMRGGEGRGGGREERAGLCTIAKAAELLLAGSIPHVEDQRAAVCVEEQRVHLHAHRRDVLLLELTLENSTNRVPSAHAQHTSCSYRTARPPPPKTRPPPLLLGQFRSDPRT